MPAEAARLNRRIGQRDRRFLAALAGAGAASAAFAVFFVLQGTAAPTRSDCITFEQAGVMGGGTWRFCGADAISYCRRHSAESTTLADRCRVLGDSASPS
jgi:hypothetical protein